MNVQKVNYQKELDKILDRIQKENKVPSLLLHSCCAPCSSYVLEYLSEYFEITVFYYNPNIYPESEYEKRIEEQQELIGKMKFRHPVSFLGGSYDKERFYETTAGMEHLKEGGARCMKCYELRLSEAAQMAAEGGFDYFTTTLSISPLKNAQKLNEIGIRLGERVGVPIWCLILKRRTVISGLRNFRRSTACTVRITAAVSSLWRSGRGKNRKRNGKIRCFLHMFDIYGRHFTL